jgi:hypothetical protein
MNGKRYSGITWEMEVVDRGVGARAIGVCSKRCPCVATALWRIVVLGDPDSPILVLYHHILYSPILEAFLLDKAHASYTVRAIAESLAHGISRATYSSESPFYCACGHLFPWFSPMACAYILSGVGSLRLNHQKTNILS